MQLFSNLSELPYNSPIKITVYQGQKAIISFLTKVVDNIEDETAYGFGIVVQAVYYQGKKLNFSQFKVVLSYMSADRRQYDFPVSATEYDYDHERLIFYSKKRAQPVNNRSAYRFEAGFSSQFKIKDAQHTFAGYVKDVSYSGVAFVCADPFKELQVGLKIHGAFVTDDNMVVHDVDGEIVRVVPNWHGQDTLIGVKLEGYNSELEKAINQLQRRLLKNRSQQKSFYH